MAHPTSYVMVPGIDGSGDDHWQTHWQRRLGPAARRIAPPSWSDVVADDWLAAVTRAVDECRHSPVVLVAHSLGCLVVADWLAHGPGRVAGAFLVAPPDRHGPRFPASAHGFENTPAELPVPAVVVASTDDPYCTPGAAVELSRAWGAGLIDVGPAGHLNAASGLADWPEGWRLLVAFVAGRAD